MDVAFQSFIATAADYVSSTYALISQASSGLLLIAAGLLILINALQIVVLKDRSEATSDPLTGLPNRRALQAVFERMTSGPGDPSAAIAILDIDHFKRVNDQWGHGKGDYVLSTIARCLDSIRPSSAMVSRIGGEEFVLLMPWQEEAIARLACEQLRMAVEQLSFRVAGTMTVSIGLTPVARNEELASALGRADQALYRAKEMGRNRCVFEPQDLSLPRAAIKLVR